MTEEGSDTGRKERERGRYLSSVVGCNGEGLGKAEVRSRKFLLNLPHEWQGPKNVYNLLLPFKTIMYFYLKGRF